MVPDGLGSVRGVASDAVSTLESRSYAPYGEPFGLTGTNHTAYGFTGEPLDDNGLLYLRARYYAPGLGVFAALDPFEGVAGRPMSLNGYSWVEGNPVNMVDSSGMLGELPGQFATCNGDDQRIPGGAVRCCGPDATKWLYREAKGHYDYAKTMSIDPTLAFIAERLQGSLILELTGFPSAKQIQLAVYGLAVDYSNIDYRALAEDSASYDPRVPFPWTWGWRDSNEPTITVCGKCLNGTNLGNFMLGVAINATGEDEYLALLAGLVFNIKQEGRLSEALNLAVLEELASLPDTQGVLAGYRFASTSAFNEDMFCRELDALGTAWHEAPKGTQYTNTPCSCDGPNLDFTPAATLKDWNQYASVITGLEQPNLTPLREFLVFIGLLNDPPIPEG